MCQKSGKPENPGIAGWKNRTIHRMWHDFLPQRKDAEIRDRAEVFRRFPKETDRISTGFQQVLKRVLKRDRKPVQKSERSSLPRIIEDPVTDCADRHRTVPGHEKDKPFRDSFQNFCKCFHNLLLFDRSFARTFQESFRRRLFQKATGV